MKKLLLILLAILTSLIIGELTVRYVFGYPAYGVQEKVAYRKGGETWTNIRSPYSGVYNLEGKQLVRLNNYGLPGLDIASLENPIVVLGSSFIEAFQYQAPVIASSILKKELERIGQPREVLNLGASGHDPYDSYFRLKYYEQKLGFKAQDLVLVINSDNQEWFPRHPLPLDFRMEADFGRVNTKLQVRLMQAARNSSALVELFIKGLLKSSGDGEVDTVNPAPHVNPWDSFSKELNAPLLSCLQAFKAEYPGFVLVSIVNDAGFNNALAGIANKMGFRFAAKPLLEKKYLIKGAGHLNLTGNRELGLLMAKVYTQDL